MITFEGVSKSFDGGRTYAVNDIHLGIRRGELFVLLGSSGSGKSTLLRIVNQLHSADQGKVELTGLDWSGENPYSLRRRIGYVIQDIGLLPHMTVEQNVSILLRLKRVSAAERRTRADRLLDKVGLPPEDFAGRFPHELSGGQQQRVGVARALAGDPELLLMDEPFGALDAITRAHLQAMLSQLHQELGKTILFVTHDLFEAVQLGDRIGVLHQGGLQQVGTAKELVQNPATDFVHDLFERSLKMAEQMESLAVRGDLAN